jgi:hypothetical protein
MAQWKRLFTQGATPFAAMRGTVHWHEALGVWGLFGETGGKNGIVRSWNPFGQKPWAFRANMIVEINVPPGGIDTNIQGVFARDAHGRPWLLRQGRMSVSEGHVADDDFMTATGLKPVEVRFSGGSTRAYYKVSELDVPAAVLQERTAAFVAHCAKARLAKREGSGSIAAAIGAVQNWERGLSPEATGEFEIAARDPVVARRRHAEVWRALAAELKRPRIPHSNDRVAQYGPDLFTYDGRDVLFEIKAGATSHDVFEAVGQLHIYEHLLSAHYGTAAYRKVLVAPKGMRSALEAPLRALDIGVLAYERHGRNVSFDLRTLTAVLK